jgi:sec-independent protein translocase protein TatC
LARPKIRDSSIFIFAAVMTPPDLISQVLMALPLMALYELSILLSKLFGKKAEPASTP